LISVATSGNELQFPIRTPPLSEYVPAGEVSYFTISSIILSFLAVVLFSKDANKRNRIFRQSGQKPKNRLSYMQRQLIVLEILVIFYTVIGGLLYSKLEGWTFNDAVYFSIITLMTCGTGDFSPETFVGRMVLIVYAVPGILLTAYTVYSIYSVISEILYAKVYKDFTRFINVSNDIFFQNLIKHNKSGTDDIQNNENILPKANISFMSNDNDNSISSNAKSEKSLKNSLKMLSNNYLDYIVLCISVDKGITNNTLIFLEMIFKLNIPVIVVFTKIDLINENDRSNILLTIIQEFLLYFKKTIHIIYIIILIFM